MKNFFKWLKIALTDMWNDLYRLLCGLAGREPEQENIVDPYED